MTHNLIIGQTQSGKSTLAKELVNSICDKTKRRLIVLDPFTSKDWNADFLTDNKQDFLNVVKNNKNCELVIDECGQTIGRYAKEMMMLATSSRHYGHRSTFITQRANQLDLNMRDQCSKLYIFSISKNDAKSLAEQFVDDELLNAYELEQFNFYYKQKFKKALKMSISDIKLTNS